MTMALRQLLPTTALSLLLCACDGGEPSRVTDSAPSPQVELSDAERQTLANAALESWQLGTPAAREAAASAAELRTATEALLQEPSAARLQDAQKQWHKLARRYQPLELYSHVAQLQPDAFKTLHHLLYATGAYPIQPGYLDSFGPYQYSGLVHDVSVAITPETLREQHGMTDAADAALGLYAIESLLFGPAGSDRQASDFEQEALTPELREQGFSGSDELPGNRRRQLLLTQAQLLADDLSQLAQHWPPEAADSLYGGLASQPPLQRYLILLRSAQIELSRVVTALGDAQPGEAQKEVPEAHDYSRPLPASLLEERVSFLQEVLKQLVDDEALQQSLRTTRQAISKLSETESIETTQAAVEAATLALEMLTTVLQSYDPQQPQEAQAAPTEEAS